jgi:ElaB/YqjD/DUF883 family membrane-anchored ribosome-binding protein
MAASKKKQATSTEDRSQDLGESTNDLGSAAGELGSAAADLGHEAQQQVVNLTEQVRQQATNQLTSQKEQAVDALETVALLLHQAGEHAQQQDKALLANYVDKAAQQVSTFSESLAQQDVTQIVETTKQYARREPMLFVGGALAAGFLGARFLRSSAQQAEQTDQEMSSDAALATVGETSLDLPAYDIDQETTASTEGMLGATSPSPSDAMTPDSTGFMDDYESAVLESDAFADDANAAVLPDIEDIENPEKL